MQHAAFTKADKKVVKVVNFVAMWLNLYPRTVSVLTPATKMPIQSCVNVFGQNETAL